MIIVTAIAGPRKNPACVTACDDVRFALRSGDVSLAEEDRLHGSVAAVFAEDAVDAAPWLTLRGGVRLTRFSGAFTETAASPRFGSIAARRRTSSGS